MKKLLFVLLSLFVTFNLFAGTCSSISRVNNSANEVLTSTKYNLDHNTAYNFVNAYDLGCGTDGTLEKGALNTTDFAVPLNAIQLGCKVSQTDADNLSIDRCKLAVNGKWVNTSTGTAVGWAALDTGSEAASTTYYVYVADGSESSTLTGLISLTGPNDDGYDDSSNRVIAKFYNNSAASIDAYSIEQWSVNDFKPGNDDWTAYTPTLTGFGSATAIAGYWKRSGGSLEIIGTFTFGTPSGVEAKMSLPSGLLVASFVTQINTGGEWFRGLSSTDKGGILLITGGDNFVNFSTANVFGADSTNPLTAANGDSLSAAGHVVIFKAKIPIDGWSN